MTDLEAESYEPAITRHRLICPTCAQGTPCSGYVLAVNTVRRTRRKEVLREVLLILAVNTALFVMFLFGLWVTRH